MRSSAPERLAFGLSKAVREAETQKRFWQEESNGNILLFFLFIEYKNRNHLWKNKKRTSKRGVGAIIALKSQMEQIDERKKPSPHPTPQNISKARLQRLWVEALHPARGSWMLG